MSRPPADEGSRGGKIRVALRHPILTAAYHVIARQDCVIVPTDGYVVMDEARAEELGDVTAAFHRLAAVADDLSRIRAGLEQPTAPPAAADADDGRRREARRRGSPTERPPGPAPHPLDLAAAGHAVRRGAAERGGGPR